MKNVSPNLFNLLSNAGGAVYLKLETEITTSRTDSAYCVRSQQPCRYRHAALANVLLCSLHPATFIIIYAYFNSFLWFRVLLGLLDGIFNERFF